jgi:hypothetical protein
LWEIPRHTLAPPHLNIFEHCFPFSPFSSLNSSRHSECTHMEEHTGEQKTWVHAINTGWNSLEVPHNPQDLR